ncbi:MAG: L-carnitine dehydrogenase [Alphaproteobacteria bacterium MarineAlpha10_Bin2]|nr:3-hydroxyacyl-CoA dehydrogenase NAD-binding domain-containing protein [Pseudomonadota bacterium]PPR22592.1 MAG: L-carnitine dehydrogenase [Alphaproteobacteria bacterium MarineAlpha10_Bin2]HIM46989.1 3-hydroxyacyl-CoA dehydrogenase family protein [Alphaproteobacteria bacterium]
MKHVAVIGMGTMGPGIAATLARGGMTVSGYDTSAEAVANSGALITGAFGVLEALGMPDNGGPEQIRMSDSLEDCVAGADLVVETVPEDLELKLDLLGQLDGLVSPDCVLASDTSGIPITRLQEGNSHPGRVVGMHWSNPPHIIPIIEVVAGEDTAPETVERMTALIRQINLLPILVKKDVPGFVENRVLYAIMRECVDLVEDGVIDAEALDQCVSWGIGYKLAVVGPMALLDMAGLDIYQAVGSYLNKELSTRSDVSPLITERTAAGRLGIKSGGGIFDYTPERIAELRQARAQKLVATRKALENR